MSNLHSIPPEKTLHPIISPNLAQAIAYFVHNRGTEHGVFIAFRIRDYLNPEDFVFECRRPFENTWLDITYHNLLSWYTESETYISPPTEIDWNKVEWVR